MAETKEAVLAQYQSDVERWKERGGHYRDIQPLSINEVLFIRQMLHPTKKAESKQVTQKLIEFICDNKIVTAKEIYEATGLSDKPVLTRMKIFQQFGLIRRESKKYYIPTQRMIEIRERYLKRICS